MPDEEWDALFLKGLTQIDNEPWSVLIEHAPHTRENGAKVSASGVGDCVTQQFYDATDTPITNPQSPAGIFYTLLGRHGQAITSAVLKAMGYTVFDEEIVVMLDDLISGHVDGKLTGLDLGSNIIVWDNKMKGVWTMFGTKKNTGFIMAAMKAAAPTTYLQIQTYIAATNADGGMVTANPFDQSAARIQAITKKVPLKPAYRVYVDQDDEAIQLATSRAKIVNVAVKANLRPQHEYNQSAEDFPCSYCEWRTRCIIDSAVPAKIVAPPIPESWSDPYSSF